MTNYRISLIALCLGVASACTQRSQTPITTPAPEQPQPATNDTNTQNTTQPTQTETTNEEQTQPNDAQTTSTESDVVDPNANPSDTPSTGGSTETATPATPATPTTNPTGTMSVEGSRVQFQDLVFTVPDGWTLHQDTFTDGVLLMAFQKGSDYFRIYAKEGTAPALQSVFVNGSQVVGQEREEKLGSQSWKRIDTQKGQVSVSGFSLTHNGHAYFGFGRSSSTQAATSAMSAFLSTIE